MPVYRVEAPDGRVMEIEAPDGATQEQVLAFAQANYQPQAQPAESGPWTRYQQAEQGPWTRYQQQDSTRLDRIGLALRRAHEVGNVEDARRLARMYVEERDKGQQAQQVEFPDGTLAEFPAGTDRDTMRAASAKYWSERGRPEAVGEAPSKPDFSNVRGGNRTTEAAFSNVRGGSRSTEAPVYSGPLLAPSQFAAGARAAPTLDEINASNRAYQRSPQAAQDRAHYEAGQVEALHREFHALPAPARFAIGAGSRVAALGRGVDQLASQAADYVAPRDRGLASLITGAPSSRYEEAMLREADARRRDQFMAGDTAATLGGITGDVGLIAMPAGAVTRAVGTTGRAALAGNVALGAGYSAAQPIVQGESRAENAAWGGAFGAGAHAVGAGVRRLGVNAANAVSTEVQQMARRAQGMGIPLHASQVSQSLPVKVAASAGKYLPFSGYGKAASRQQEAVNRAVARTFGTDAPKLTDDVMHRARQDLSRQFDEIYNRNSVPIGELGARRLADIERTASRRLTNDEAQVLRNQLDDILANAEDGVLTGQKYQAVRTALRKAEGNDKLGIAVRELRQALDDIAADAVGPQDSIALKALRSRWANFRTVEAALKQNAGAGGDIRLAALWPLVRKGSTKEMRELARMGQTLLKDPIADSGTAQRTLIYNLLMGGGSLANPSLIPLIAKAATGGATLGRVANSNGLARLLARSNRGQATSTLGGWLQQGAPYVGPTAGAEATRRNQR